MPVMLPGGLAGAYARRIFAASGVSFQLEAHLSSVPSCFPIALARSFFFYAVIYLVVS
jgi:hypothetical protein